MTDSTAGQPHTVARAVRSFAVAAIFLATLAPSGAVAASVRPTSGSMTIRQSNNRIVSDAPASGSSSAARTAPSADVPASRANHSTIARSEASLAAPDPTVATGPAGVTYPFSWAGSTAAPPATNALTAGGFMTVRFDLGGNRGLGILFDGTWPRSQRYNCTTGALVVDSQFRTRPFGALGLSYNSGTGLYTYTWQTREEWSNTCRRFQLKLDDGTTHYAKFRIATFRFIAPTLRYPHLNFAVAGSKVKVRFHMGASAAPQPIAAGSPRSRQYDCVSGAFIGPWAQTNPHPPAGLVRNPSTPDYRYAWQTNAGWTGTCRRFEMKMLDGTVEVLRFRFNRPPNAVNDSGAGFTTDEATAFTTGNVLANDSDPDGDSLTVSGFFTGGTDGTVANNGDGTFLYGPNAQFESLGSGEQATDFFLYSISDGNGGSDNATVSITVNGLNDAPTMAAQARSVPENSATGTNVGAPVAFNDVDTTDGHTFAITAGNGSGALAINASTGQITVADGSQLDHETTPSYALTVSVTDDGTPNLSDSATVTVTVTDAANSSRLASMSI